MGASCNSEADIIEKVTVPNSSSNNNNNINESEEEEEDADITYENGGIILKKKAVFLGKEAVGKSSITLRFVRNEFYRSQESTIGAAFLTKELEDAANNARVKFEMWDTSGQERYDSIAPMYYRGARVLFCVYDVTSERTFEGAKKWVIKVKKEVPNILVFLVGNKIDLEQEQKVTSAEVEKFAKEHGIISYRVSAKTNKNIKALFNEAASRLIKDYFENLGKEKQEKVEDEIKYVIQKGSNPFSCFVRSKKNHRGFPAIVTLKQNKIIINKYNDKKKSTLKYSSVNFLKVSEKFNRIMIGFNGQKKENHLFIFNKKAELQRMIFELKLKLPFSPSDDNAIFDLVDTYQRLCKFYQLQSKKRVTDSLNDSSELIDLRSLNLLENYKPLFSTIRWSIFKKIDLRSTKINDEGIHYFCENVPPTLEILILMMNENIGVSGAVSIGSLFIKDIKLRMLDLKQTGIGDEGTIKIFRDLSNCEAISLEKIDLSYNNLTDSVVEPINKFLLGCKEKKCSIKEIILNENNFTSNTLIDFSLKKKINIDGNLNVGMNAKEEQFLEVNKTKEKENEKTTTSIRLYNWKEIMELLKSEYHNKIGEGAFGKVFKVNIEKKIYAVKVVFLSLELDIDDEIEEYKNEINILSSLNHPYIIKTKGWAEKKTEKGYNFALITEYCPYSLKGGELHERKDDGSTKKIILSFREKCEFLLQIAEALDFLHQNNILHRDLKLANCVVDKRKRIKIIDFGLAKSVEKMSKLYHTSKRGTVDHIAPEVLISDQSKPGLSKYSKKCDVYSFSIIMYCMYYNTSDPYNMKEKMKEGVFPMSYIPNFVLKGGRPEIKDYEKEHEWMINLIRKCWSKDEDDRLPFNEIIEEFENY